MLANKGNHLVLGENPPAMPRSPHIRMARWPKTPGKLERYIGAESVHAIRRKVKVVFVMCTVGEFIRFVDIVKQ